jgi:chorismate mutase
MPRAQEDRLQLERKFEELCAQVREYPTPIARCDEQLSALIEERTRVLQELKKHES